MDDDAIWTAIHAQRAALADILDTLTEAEWAHDSLCAGWTVRDVAAHVISSADAGIGEIVTAMLRARGNFNRCMFDVAKRRSARPTAQIVADYRRLGGSRRHPPGTTKWDPLVDVLVHTQDIVRPLGRVRPMPPELAAAAGHYLWGKGFPYHAQQRLGGLRLTATDVDFAVGTGAPVSGPMGSVLLLLAGRTASIPELTGEGVGVLH